MRAVIPVIRRGEMRNFRHAETITRRIIYREEVGADEEGRVVEAAIAYNREGDRNVWLVALVLVDGQVWARAPFGQAVRLVSVERALRAWQRAVGYQLKRIMDEPGRFIWRSRRLESARAALEAVWPEHLKRLEAAGGSK